LLVVLSLVSDNQYSLLSTVADEASIADEACADSVSSLEIHSNTSDTAASTAACVIDSVSSLETHSNTSDTAASTAACVIDSSEENVTESNELILLLIGFYSVYCWSAFDAVRKFVTAASLTVARWLSGRASDLRSKSREFEARPRCCCATTLGKLFTPYCLCH